MNRSLYFAYGSNLDAGRMKERCPDSDPISEAWLAGWRFTFAGQSRLWGVGGVATLFPEPGGLVTGRLYHVSEADLAALDVIEGHPTVYRRVWMRLEAPVGVRSAWCYLLPPGTQETAPTPSYRAAVLAAYEALGFELPDALKASAGHSG